MDARTIVVGTDGTTASDTAVRWAAREAAAQGATLRILYAYRGAEQPAGCDLAGAHVDPERRLAEVVLTAAAKQAIAAAPGVPLETTAVAGPAAEELLQLATDATLLVVGCHGRGGLSEIVLHSAGRRLTEAAPCPIVVVRGSADTAGGPVVAGLAEAAGAGPLLAVAFHTAAAHHAPLLVVRSVPTMDPLWIGDVLAARAGQPSDDAESKARLDQQLDVWRRLYPQVHAEVAIAHDDAAAVLTAISRRARLLVVGSTVHSTLPGILLGSTSLRLTHYAHCPVLIVRRGDVAAQRA